MVEKGKGLNVAAERSDGVNLLLGSAFSVGDEMEGVALKRVGETYASA